MQANHKDRGLGAVVLVGLALALVGAALDFYSGYQMMSASGAGMTMIRSSALGTAWGAGVAALGVVLVVTALVSISSLGHGRMALFGTLMVAYGVLMLLVGAGMDTGLTPAMESASLTGQAMLSVGALMVINGVVMLRTRGMPIRTRSP